MNTLIDDLHEIGNAWGRLTKPISSTRVYKVLEEVEFLRTRGILVSKGLGRLNNIIDGYNPPVKIDGEEVFKGDILYACPFNAHTGLHRNPFVCFSRSLHRWDIDAVQIIAAEGFPERDDD